MATSWILVERADGTGQGNNVYIDANYTEEAGYVGTAFRTTTGSHRFETLGRDRLPNWRANKIIDKPAGNSKTNPILVITTPV